MKTVDKLETELMEIAKECARKGPGYAQEGVVLREAAKRLQIETGNEDLREQQALLTAWHELFRRGILSWGYNVNNPTSPFFHFVEQGK
jgi:hypothetical protein